MTIPFDGEPLHAQRDRIVELADLGYTDVWSAEANGADAFTPLALASVWAPSLRLGTAIVPGLHAGPGAAWPSRSARWPRPRRAASRSASARSSNVIVERWNGIPFEEPYQQVRDTLRFLRGRAGRREGHEEYETFRSTASLGVAARAGADPRRRPARGDAAPRRPRGRRRHHQLAVGRRRRHGRADRARGGCRRRPDRAEIVRPHLRGPVRRRRHRAGDGQVRHRRLPDRARLRRVPRWLGRGDAARPGMWEAWKEGDRKAAARRHPRLARRRAHRARARPSSAASTCSATSTTASPRWPWRPLPFGIDVRQAVPRPRPAVDGRRAGRRAGVGGARSLAAVVGARPVGATAPARRRRARPRVRAGRSAGHLRGHGRRRPTRRPTSTCPFDVAAGTTRVEVTYDWTDAGRARRRAVDATVFDLGLWDADGLGTPDGFRGWSGSRAGRRDRGSRRCSSSRTSPPAATARRRSSRARGASTSASPPSTPPAPTGPSPSRCTAPGRRAGRSCPIRSTRRTSPDPSPAGTTATSTCTATTRTPRRPSGRTMVDEARGRRPRLPPDHRLRHRPALGRARRRCSEANPDVAHLARAGRSSPTSATPTRSARRRRCSTTATASPGVSLARHPGRDASPTAPCSRSTTRRSSRARCSRNFCRGCEFELGDVIDWDQVDTIEVLTGPVARSSPTELGLPDAGVLIPNPFMSPAIDRWEALLRAGLPDHRGVGLGLQGRRGRRRARRWGTQRHRGVRRGALAGRRSSRRSGPATPTCAPAASTGSPELEFTAAAPDGTHGDDRRHARRRHRRR